MSTLDSSSTLAQIEAAYDDNASYEEDGSVAKAKVFVTACRMLVRRYRKKVQRGGGTAIETEVARLQDELKRASTYVAQHDTAGNRGGGAKYVSFENFRS